MQESSIHNMSTTDIDYESMPETSPLYYQLIAGAFAGIMEHSVMFPVDAIKTRIQSSHSQIINNTNIGVKNSISQAAANTNISNVTVKNGLIRQINKIATTEGSLALWKGVQSVILGAGPAHAIYFGTYEFCKSKLITNNPNVTDSHQPIRTAVSGAAATIASDALMNPFDTIKQRLQLSSTRQNVKVWEISKQIYATEGFSAFYYSYPTTIAMNIPFTALNFVVYESSTKILNPTGIYNPFIHCICGGLSGTICAAMTTPLDVIKTTLQVRGSKEVALQIFKDADTFNKAAKAIYKMHGWKGFLCGLKPRIIATMPATAISWTAYECAKHFLLSNFANPNSSSDTLI